MKKLLFFLSVIVLILSFSNASFALNTGFWSLADGDIFNGSWNEMFHGGGPGLPGNKFHAQDTADHNYTSLQWWIGSFALKNVNEDPSGDYDWITEYKNGYFLFEDMHYAPWNDTYSPVLIYNALTAINKSNSDDGLLSFDIVMSGKYGIYDITLTGSFEGSVAGGDYWYITDTDEIGNEVVIGHAGSGFDSLTLTISVPEPATMLLLGSGLIGLVGFRRKFKK